MHPSLVHDGSRFDIFNERSVTRVMSYIRKRRYHTCTTASGKLNEIHIPELIMLATRPSIIDPYPIGYSSLDIVEDTHAHPKPTLALVTGDNEGWLSLNFVFEGGRTGPFSI